MGTLQNISHVSNNDSILGGEQSGPDTITAEHLQGANKKNLSFTFISFSGLLLLSQCFLTNTHTSRLPRTHRRETWVTLLPVQTESSQQSSGLLPPHLSVHPFIHESVHLSIHQHLNNSVCYLLNYQRSAHMWDLIMEVRWGRVHPHPLSNLQTPLKWDSVACSLHLHSNIKKQNAGCTEESRLNT